MTKHTAYISPVLALILGGCAMLQPSSLHSPPAVLPHTTLEMKTAGFWTSRHPSPDAVIMSPEEIIRFNQKVLELKLTEDLSARPPAISGEELRAALQKTLEELQARGLVFLDGKKPTAAYWAAAREAMNLEDIPASISRAYGLIVHYAGQRFFPLEEGLYAQANDVDFDELQNSALDIGTPVVILHRSADGRWLWVESSASAGWVKAENAATAAEDQVKPFWSTPFVIVAVPKADIYRNSGMTDFAGAVQMGTRFPLKSLDEGYAEIIVPQRRGDGTAALVSGFISAGQVHEGYFSYTPRRILLQAFKLLHQPYGWGGMYGEQDCSRFLQEIFAAVGIELPRDSKDQIQAGELLASWETGAGTKDKIRVLEESGIGGITLLGMKGHIMLYLGNTDGRAYAIHAVWAYRKPGKGADDVYVLNRVVVSDLSLGEGSKRGSLLERLNAVRIVK